jgi:hypothetical protein
LVFGLQAKIRIQDLLHKKHFVGHAGGEYKNRMRTRKRRRKKFKFFAIKKICLL